MTGPDFKGTVCVDSIAVIFNNYVSIFSTCWFHALLFLHLSRCPVIIRVIPPGVEGFSDSTRLVDIQVESLTHRNRLPRFVTLHLSPIVVSALSSPPLSTMGADGKNLRGNKLRQQHVTQKRRLSCAFRLADGKTDGGNLRAAIQGTLYARTAASSVDDGTEGSISCQSPEQTELPQLKQNESMHLLVCVCLTYLLFLFASVYVHVGVFGR